MFFDKLLSQLLHIITKFHCQYSSIVYQLSCRQTLERFDGCDKCSVNFLTGFSVICSSFFCLHVMPKQNSESYVKQCLLCLVSLPCSTIYCPDQLIAHAASYYLECDQLLLSNNARAIARTLRYNAITNKSVITPCSRAVQEIQLESKRHSLSGSSCIFYTALKRY